MRLNDVDLERMMSEGESFLVEFKESLAGKALEGIQEAVCAFANDLAGSGQSGVIFVGVKDNGEPSRIDITEPMLTQLSGIKTDGNILPPPSMLVEKRVLKGVDVAVVTVLPSNSPPVRYKGVIHIRMGLEGGLRPNRTSVSSTRSGVLTISRSMFSPCPERLFPTSIFGSLKTSTSRMRSVPRH